jgi:hypothetical protein
MPNSSNSSRHASVAKHQPCVSNKHDASNGLMKEANPNSLITWLLPQAALRWLPHGRVHSGECYVSERYFFFLNTTMLGIWLSRSGFHKVGCQIAKVLQRKYYTYLWCIFLRSYQTRLKYIASYLLLRCSGGTVRFNVLISDIPVELTSRTPKEARATQCWSLSGVHPSCQSIKMTPSNNANYLANIWKTPCRS